MYPLYRILSSLLSPAVPLLLKRRLARGKEDPVRLNERIGHASLPRPQGTLIWIHAASIGEASAVLPLIETLLAQHESLFILLTTVTLTSAALMEKRLPPRGLHQFAPVDTPQAVNRFLSHWRPDMALWVDSEFWPNLIRLTHARNIVMGLVNARISEHSYRAWRKAVGFMKGLLGCFSFCFAQSEADGQRLKSLGLACPVRVGNLKYDAPPLPCDPDELQRLRTLAQGRPVWVAASTHPGEEAAIVQAHAILKNNGLRPLTVIVPRHATRGDEIASLLSSYNVARRSRREPLTAETDMYLADTMGELGLFYRLASIAFIGGTLVPHGGQNPLEAARLGCVVVAGPHMENFAIIAQSMEQERALSRVNNAESLASELEALLAAGNTRSERAAAAQMHVRSHEGILSAIDGTLTPYLLKAG